MSDTLYNEWVPAGLFVKIVLSFVSFLILCVLLVTVAVCIAVQNPFWIVISASTLAFLLLLLWNYRGIQIQITKNELLIRYGFFNRKCMSLADIVACEPTKASFGKYWGVGIRYGLDSSFAYTTSFGNAVKITPKKGIPFVFSSNNPEKICIIINQTKNVS